jgi:hypothetical protein
MPGWGRTLSSSLCTLWGGTGLGRSGKIRASDLVGQDDETVTDRIRACEILD